MNIRIDVGDDLKRVTASLGAFADKQIAFASAQALNALGARVQAAEKAEIKKQFPTATPFTVGSVGQIKARKSDPETVIFVRDIAAAYLAPYLNAGRHKLNSRALLNPKNINLNQYGNIPRNRLAALKGRPDIFIGTVKGKSGSIDGVWQRVGAVAERKATKKRAARAAAPAHLKLLIRFGDALPVKQTLHWGDTAKAIVDANFDKEFGKALAQAMATARLK